MCRFLAHQIIIGHSHANMIAFTIIIVVILMNIVNNILLRQKVYKINKKLTKEIELLKIRLHKWEQDC